MSPESATEEVLIEEAMRLGGHQSREAVVRQRWKPMCAVKRRWRSSATSALSTSMRAMTIRPKETPAAPVCAKAETKAALASHRQRRGNGFPHRWATDAYRFVPQPLRLKSLGIVSRNLSRMKGRCQAKFVFNGKRTLPVPDTAPCVPKERLLQQSPAIRRRPRRRTSSEPVRSSGRAPATEPRPRRIGRDRRRGGRSVRGGSARRRRPFWKPLPSGAYSLRPPSLPLHNANPPHHFSRSFR